MVLYKIIFLFSLTVASLKSFEQLPVQIFAGDKSIEYNFLWFKNVDKNEKVTLFNSTFFNVHYKDKDKNVYEVFQVATYNLNKNWGIGGGGRFTGGEFVPQFSVSYQLMTESLYLNLFPSLQYSLSAKGIQYSLFGLLFYTPKINKSWKMFNQISFEPLFNNYQHIYSYQQIRVGLSYKDMVQFGVGVNLDQVNKSFLFNKNIGFFVRKELR